MCLALWNQHLLNTIREAGNTDISSPPNVSVNRGVHGANVGLVTLSVQTNRLGWDSFLEGCLSSHWLTVVAPLLWQQSQYLIPPVWGRLLISKLHNVIHKQWVYRNSYIHFKGNSGLTMLEQHDIINRVVAYALIDPDTLLPQYWLLFETDFEALGSSPASNCPCG